MADKKILAIRIQAALPGMNETVLISAFIDSSANELLLYYPTAILGTEHDDITILLI